MSLAVDPGSGGFASPATSRPTASRPRREAVGLPGGPSGRSGRGTSTSRRPAIRASRTGRSPSWSTRTWSAATAGSRHADGFSLLEANPEDPVLQALYKFFPLWFSHAWSMKAASAADCCLFRLAGQRCSRSRSIYAPAATLTVAAIDGMAMTLAEAAGVPRADFLACYLREGLGEHHRDIEEGQAARASNRRRPQSTGPTGTR